MGFLFCFLFKQYFILKNGLDSRLKAFNMRIIWVCIITLLMFLEIEEMFLILIILHYIRFIRPHNGFKGTKPESEGSPGRRRLVHRLQTIRSDDAGTVKPAPVRAECGGIPPPERLRWPGHGLGVPGDPWQPARGQILFH